MATRGYAENGAGAEVRFGEGIGGHGRRGTQANSHLGPPARHALRLRDAQGSAGDRSRPPRPQIPLPGLANPESQLGVPLLVRGELVGVLVLESEVPYRFHEEDKASIELLGSYLAIAMQNMQLRSARRSSRTPMDVRRRARRGRGRASRPREPPSATSVVFYHADECILLDGEYLIRSLPARILWRLLTAHEQTGRTSSPIASCAWTSR